VAASKLQAAPVWIKPPDPPAPEKAVAAVNKRFEILGGNRPEFPDIGHAVDFRASERVGPLAELVRLSRLDGASLTFPRYRVVAGPRLRFRGPAPGYFRTIVFALDRPLRFYKSAV
jgi:hypothetical protein